MRKLFTHLLLLLVGLLFGWLPGLRAQSLDPAFVPTVLKSGSLSSPLTGVNTLAVQPDGKYLVAGGFDFVNGNLTGKLLRFNASGTVDATFNAGTGANAYISALQLQPDGKLLVAGAFNAFNGTAAANLVRLNADGSLDNTFASPSSGVPHPALTLALQPNGKIIVGGGIFDTNLQPSQGIIRLNADGSRDTSFTPFSGFTTGSVLALLVQPDGKILVGGSFLDFNSQPGTSSLTRLNTNGTLDNSFQAGTPNSFGGQVSALLRQPSGKLLVGGSIRLGSTNSARLLRLLTDGSIDNTFTPGTGPNAGLVTSMVQQSSGAVLLGGTFTQYNGVARGCLARVSADGVLDPGFAPAAGANGGLTSLAETSTGQLLISGSFTQYDGSSQAGLAQLSSTGSLNATFAPQLEARAYVTQLLPLANGQFLISGDIGSFNGTALPGAPTLPRRLNADGSLDASFAAATSGRLQAVLPGGGSYVLVNTQTGLRRLQANGSLENGFTPLAVAAGSGQGAYQTTLSGAVLQPDGKVLLYGRFSTYGSTLRNGLVRLNADGSLDTSFTPPASATLPADLNAFRQVQAVHLLPNGQLLYQWLSLNTGSQYQLTRLNADGSEDTAFNIGSGPYFDLSYIIYNLTILPQPDGRLLLAGGFTSFNGQNTPQGVVRLTTTGAVDPTFAPTQYYVPRCLQPDGRILATTEAVAGTGNVNSQLMRLNADGSRDASFSPVALPQTFTTNDDVLLNVVLQPTTNNILLAGSFRYVAGQPRIGLARLTNTTVATKPAGQLPQPLTLYPNPAQQQVTVQLPAAAEQLRLLDLQGRLVQQHRLPARQTTATLELGNLPAGLYLVQVVGPASLYQQRLLVTP